MANRDRGCEDILLSALETLLRGASDLVYVKDEHLRYVGASQGFCDMFSLRDQEAIAGKTDYDLFPRPLADAAYADDRAVLEGGTPDAARFDILCVSRTPIVAPDGRIVGLCGVIDNFACDPKTRTEPKSNDYRIDASLSRPIRLGGTFVAGLEDDLPVMQASASFIEMLGRREGAGWIHPEDASILLRRARSSNAGGFLFFARLLTASGQQILTRLECRVPPGGNELHGAAFNISDELLAQRTADQLRIASTIIERLTSAALDWVSIIDAQTGIMTVVNLSHPSQCALPGDRLDYRAGYEGYFRERVVASEVEDCVRRMSLDAIISALENGDRYELSYSLHEGDEIRRKRWVFSYLDQKRDAILHMRSDVTDAYAMQFDPVSGLYNRHQFQREARNLLDAHPERRFLFVRFDIDNFRVFNDLYGVSAGNRLIASIKDLIVTFHTPLSICGHIDADHFACLLPEDDYHLVPTIEKIRKWLKSHNPDFDFSPKVGVYAVEDPALDVATMSDRALLALNSIKRKYNVHLARYTEEMRERMLGEQEIVNEMSHALENGEFVPYLQPQYDYRTGAMIGAELLLRWNHPRKGLLMPKDFVPIFERNGFITQIDKHIWATACQTQRRWLDMGFSIVPLSVNVSRVDINDPDLCHTLRRLIEQYDLNANHLRIEITETAYVRHPEQLIETVKKLREMGFLVEMDDFGSGYSSLNMLRDVEVDVLKLDMSFLRDYKTTRRGDCILRSVIRMARLLKIPVVAEGVETREQAEYLAHVGCRLMQGYFFAHPMPATKFEALLTRVNSAD